MDYQKFITSLPELYQDWGQASSRPKTDKFQQTLEQIEGLTTPQIMQLLNLAVACMEPQEIYCEIGCFQGGNLIGALLDNPDTMAYAVEDFSQFDALEDSFEQLTHNLGKFSLEERVFLCDQNIEEFLLELRNLETEDKIGVYFYDGPHDYRAHLMGLSLVTPLLADQALIIISNSSWDAVRQANWDFLTTHPQCTLLLDLGTDEYHNTWNGLQVFSWDAGQTQNYDWSTLQQNQNQSVLKSIYNLPSQDKKKVISEQHKQALNLHNSGEANKTSEKLKQLLHTDRNNPDSWLELGIFYIINQQYQKARVVLQKSLEIDPAKADTNYNSALVMENLGDIPQAVRFYKQAIALNPKLIDAYNNLGNLFYQAGNLEQAEANYRDSIAANPEHFGSYLNLGNVLMEQQKVDQAVENYQKALQLKPRDPDILYNLSLALNAQKDPEQAALYSGYCYYRRGESKQAIAELEKYRQSRIGDPDFYFNLADCYKSIKNYEKAVEIYREGISHYPTDSVLNYSLVLSLQETGRTEEAINIAHQISLLLPDDLSFKQFKNLILPILYDTPEEIEHYRQQFIQAIETLIQQLKLDTKEQKETALEAIGRRTNFYLQYQGRNDVELQKHYGDFVHKIMAANYPQWVNPLPIPPLTPGGKIRIGYISPFFKQHTVGKLLLGWFKHHNIKEFEIYSYYISRQEDPMTQIFRVCSDVFHPIPDDLETVCQQILNDKLHILVFTDIGMHPQITQMVGLRLAPIQCTTWGHPITSGSPTIDYYLSSDLMEPENAQEHYSETLIRLPNIAFSYKKPDIPAPEKNRADFGLREESILYLSCQSLFKYLPQYDWIFAEIARQLPTAQFAFLSHDSPLITQQFQRRIQRAFANLNLNSQDYCVFLSRVSWPDYLTLNLISDIFLDTFAWSGGNTTLEAIACNLPVVTCPGEFMRGRHSAGILKMLGITETIAQNEAEYIDIAVKLGKNKQWRKELSQRISQRHSSVYEDTVCVAALEAFYKQVISQSLAPSSPSI